MTAGHRSLLAQDSGHFVHLASTAASPASLVLLSMSVYPGTLQDGVGLLIAHDMFLYRSDFGDRFIRHGINITPSRLSSRAPPAGNGHDRVGQISRPPTGSPTVR